MRANKSRDTSPEKAIRSILHRRGLRYRTHAQPIAHLRCNPDLVFSRAQLAVFVDGCWWHGCPEHGELPRANRSWWRQKFQKTKERDHRNNQALIEAGWKVIRVWEHENPGDAADLIESAYLASLGSPEN